MVNNNVKAVYEKELISVLKDLFLYDKIIENKINCVNCGKKITLKNLQYIIPISKENKIIITCNQPSCIKKVGEYNYVR
ncbi:MAG: hypothetical protein PHS06_01275 [Candidatus Shapirobacteria bacterium]|nr:hypothetical protein [Candidatus Shapirobacteria bacterium]